MINKKKEKLYISDFIDDPAVAYPAYYILSRSTANNEMLHDALIALHSFAFDRYRHPVEYSQIFATLHSGAFAIYKEKYAVGYFGGKLMYLESHGWKSMPVTEEVFKLENWLIG